MGFICVPLLIFIPLSTSSVCNSYHTFTAALPPDPMARPVHNTTTPLLVPFYDTEVPFHPRQTKIERIKELAKWLADDVGMADDAPMVYDVPALLRNYGGELLDLGIHSPEFIATFCEPGDIASFTWMNDAHKDALLLWIEENKRIN
jgi:hypothetical protein